MANEISIGSKVSYTNEPLFGDDIKVIKGEVVVEKKSIMVVKKPDGIKTITLETCAGDDTPVRVEDIFIDGNEASATKFSTFWPDHGFRFFQAAKVGEITCLPADVLDVKAP